MLPIIIAKTFHRLTMTDSRVRRLNQARFQVWADGGVAPPCTHSAAEDLVTSAWEWKGLEGGNSHRIDASWFCVELLVPWMKEERGASSAAWTTMCSRTKTGQYTELESHLPRFHQGQSSGKTLWLLVRDDKA